MRSSDDTCTQGTGEDRLNDALLASRNVSLAVAIQFPLGSKTGKERAGVIWGQFEAAAPEMAASGRAQFEQSGVVLIGTIRKDGSPRISCVEPCILDGVFYLGMMWQSRKALDLLQDSRIVVHNTIYTSTGDEVEFSLRGRAIDIRDLEVRRRYASERTHWQEPNFHLFSLNIESASLVEYGRGEQSVKVWPLGREFRRPYG